MNAFVLFLSEGFECAEKPNGRQAVTQKGFFCWVGFVPAQNRDVLHCPTWASSVSKIKAAAESQQLYRPLDQEPVTASRPLACCLFDVLKQFIFVMISKRMRTAIKQARYTLSAEGPSRPAALPSLFYFISLGFWLMSVTANGNKMLVRVCAVAWEHRLWYIVRPFASVSWLPCHRLHVYWLGVNKARASTYFALAPLCKKVMLPLKWSDILSANKNAFVVMPASLLFFFLHCVWSAVWRRVVVFTLTLIVIVGNKLKGEGKKNKWCQLLTLPAGCLGDFSLLSVMLTSDSGIYLCIWRSLCVTAFKPSCVGSLLQACHL